MKSAPPFTFWFLPTTTAWWRLVTSSTAVGRCTHDRCQKSMTSLGQVSQQSYGSTQYLGQIRHTCVLQLLPLLVHYNLTYTSTTIAKATSYSIYSTYCYYPDKVVDHLKAWATNRCCPRCRFPFRSCGMLLLSFQLLLS